MIIVSMRPMGLLARKHLTYPVLPDLKEMIPTFHMVGVVINILPAGQVPHALDGKIMHVVLTGRTMLIV